MLSQYFEAVSRKDHTIKPSSIEQVAIDVIVQAIMTCRDVSHCCDNASGMMPAYECFCGDATASDGLTGRLKELQSPVRLVQSYFS